MNTNVLFKKNVPGYGLVQVYDRKVGDVPVRVLMVDKSVETVQFQTPALQNELYSGYLREFDWISKLCPNLQSTLLIGGGGFAYPKYYLSHYRFVSIDVVEISSLMYHLAQKYFGLDDLLNQPLTDYKKRLNVHIEDGLDYLKRTDNVYDAILNDAYTGRQFNKGLTSEEGCHLIRQHLKDGGVYVLNCVTAVKGPRSLPGKRVLRRLGGTFRYTFEMQVYDDLSPYATQNCLIFASDKDFEM